MIYLDQHKRSTNRGNFFRNISQFGLYWSIFFKNYLFQPFYKASDTLHSLEEVENYVVAELRKAKEEAIARFPGAERIGYSVKTIVEEHLE